jgi:hypothetical protein
VPHAIAGRAHNPYQALPEHLVQSYPSLNEHTVGYGPFWGNGIPEHLQYLLATRPWPGGENKIDGRISYRTDFEAIGAFLLPCAATGVSLLAVWRRIGATPRGQPWTPAVTLPHDATG